jgi:hypothetical protein
MRESREMIIWAVTVALLGGQEAGYIQADVPKAVQLEVTRKLRSSAGTWEI